MSRVIVAVRPSGPVPYDGLVLPLTSPDGRFLAAQTGRPPTWPTLLAEPGAVPPLATRLRIYQLPMPAPGGAPTAQRATPREIAPAASLSGILLGRSADHRGFLVEAPRPDGSRWIGRVEWETGELSWLVEGDDVNAQATLTPDGGLAWVRRDAAGSVGRAELLLRTVATDPSTERPCGLPDETYAFPICGIAPDRLYAFAMRSGTGRSGSLTLIELALRSEAGPTPGPLEVVGRLNLDISGGAAAAYQCVAASQTPVPLGPEAGAVGEPAAPGGVVMFLPQARAACLVNPSMGAMTPILRGAPAAVPMWDAGGFGFLATSPDGLVYCPFTPEKGGEQRSNSELPVPVLSGDDVPRRTDRADGAMVLLGPPEDGTGNTIETRLMAPHQAPNEYRIERDKESDAAR